MAKEKAAEKTSALLFVKIIITDQNPPFDKIGISYIRYLAAGSATAFYLRLI